MKMTKQRHAHISNAPQQHSLCSKRKRLIRLADSRHSLAFSSLSHPFRAQRTQSKRTRGSERGERRRTRAASLRSACKYRVGIPRAYRPLFKSAVAASAQIRVNDCPLPPPPFRYSYVCIIGERCARTMYNFAFPHVASFA